MPARLPTPSAQFSAFLSRFPPEIVSLAKRCMSRLRHALPGTNQIVYDYAHSVVVSFSMSEHGYEAIVAIAISPEAVRLYVDKSLPDPKGLLEGTGTKVRSVTVNSAADIDRGDVHALIKAAIRHSGVTLPRTGSNTMIIKSKSKNSKPKKTGRV